MSKRCQMSDVRCQGRTCMLLCAVCCLLFTVSLLPPASAAPQATVTEVARELICDCPDCGKQSLDQCATCAVGQKYRAVIAEQLKQGHSKEQIITYFADTYGEHMLGNPRPRGFNRTAVLMPLLAVALGAIPLALVMRSRRQVPATEPASSSAQETAEPSAPVKSAPEDPRVTAALREFDF
jgi:cytochrome c-type biogenesis protein CcmH/NrfF